MSKVWDAIKRVERERELAERNRTSEDSRPLATYLSGVRRRCEERFAGDEPRPRGRASKP